MRLPFRSLILTTTVLGYALSPCVVFAADAEQAQIKELQAEIYALQKRLDQLASTQQKAATSETASAIPVATSAATPRAVTPTPAEAVKSDDYVTKGSFPGSFKIPSSDTSIKIGGYAKVDVIEDVGSGYGSNYAKFYAIPLDNTPQAHQDSQTTFGAQQTRLNFETRTPSSLGEIKTFVEADFYGANAANGNTNGYGLELRHAYGSIGSVLAGQTWSNFVDSDAMPETMDYIGPAGSIFARQAQVRYTHAVGSAILSASVEAPIGNQSTATQNAITYVGTTNSAHGSMPDLVARADYKYTKNDYVSLRAVGNQLNVDHAPTATTNATVTKYGYGVALSGKQGFLDKDAVLYDVVYGNGTGRYVYDIGATDNYYKSSTNQLDAQNYYAGTLGIQHVWSEYFRTNIFGGGARIINNTFFSGTTANKYIISGHANLIWQPLLSTKVGLEYMHGYRKIESGVDGTLNRVQASFIYGF